MNNYASAKAVRREVAEIVRPPRRLKVSDAAEQYVQLKIPGGYHGPFKNAMVPYMREPQDMTTSRKHKGLIFVGPAQSAKTQALIDNWIAYTVMCDPADMILIQTSQDAARDFSRRRLDRMHRNCPDIDRRLSKRRKDDNTYDKHYKTGQIVTLGWPSINVLSGKAIKYMALTDYDRMPQDIDGEGDGFGLAVKRTTTFLSGGMTVAESSPGYEVIDPKWRATTPHEAPPSYGIVSLYNRGDRRRWYWPCPECNEYFEPSFSLLKYHYDGSDIYAAANSVVMACPHCAAAIEPRHKLHMNIAGMWVAEGQTVKDGKLVGQARQSDIVSYWLKGPAAAFQTWGQLVINYLQAEQEYNETGEQEALKTTVNVDQGEPYVRRKSGNDRDPATLEARATEIEKRTAPGWTRFLLAAVDVQKNRFVVQVHGFGPYLEQSVVDRFSLKFSHRYDETGEAHNINPAGYLEDWNILIKHVLQKTYSVGVNGPHMQIAGVFCDTGGEAGVTDNAYKFYRHLKSEGLHRRFHLVKGGSAKSAPHVKKTFPDNRSRKDRTASAYGDVPVFILNTNLLKDGVTADLERDTPGPGYVHFPKWLGPWFYNELTAEERTDKGWINRNRARNEAFDLAVYVRAGLHVLNAFKINWQRPPKWAETLETNTTIVAEKFEDAPEDQAQPKFTRPKNVRKRRNFVNRYSRK